MEVEFFNFFVTAILGVLESLSNQNCNKQVIFYFQFENIFLKKCETFFIWLLNWIFYA